MLESVNIHIKEDEGAYVTPEAIRDCMESLAGWLEGCFRLQGCVIEFVIDWESQLDMHSYYCDMEEHIMQTELEDWEAECPEAFMRYEFDTTSPREDPDYSNMPDDLRDAICARALRAIVDDCCKALEAARDVLEKKGTRYSLTKLEPSRPLEAASFAERRLESGRKIPLKQTSL